MLNRRAVRRGRCYLLWALVGFAALQIAFGVAIDWKLSAVRDATFVHKRWQLQARLSEHPGAPLVLALGSSRTMMGVLASRLHLSSAGKPAVVYNYSIPGSGPLTQLITLRRLVNDGVRPEAILIEVMPGQFNRVIGRPVDEKNLDGGRLRAGELVSAARLAKVPRILVANWLTARCLPCYWYASELGLNGAQRPEWRRPLGAEPPLTDGFGWQAGLWRVTPEQRKLRTDFAVGQYVDVYTKDEVAAEPVRELRMMLELCREKGILVHLVVPPESSQFRALYSQAFVADFEAVLSDICREYALSLTNAQDWLADERFYDGLHELPEGAAEYTRRLERTLLSLENLRSLPVTDSVGLVRQSRHGRDVRPDCSPDRPS
jgi:hypothetical protein